MAIDLKRYESLKATAAEAERKAERASGVLEQLKRELLEQFGCKTIKQARHLLAKLDAQTAEEEDKFNTELAEFEKEFGDLLDG